jgi:hypothetical protein
VKYFHEMAGAAIRVLIASDLAQKKWEDTYGRQ